jgi:hypothetical protein
MITAGRLDPFQSFPLCLLVLGRLQILAFKTQVANYVRPHKSFDEATDIISAYTLT